MTDLNEKYPWKNRMEQILYCARDIIKNDVFIDHCRIDNILTEAIIRLYFDKELCTYRSLVIRLAYEELSKGFIDSEAEPYPYPGT